MSYILDVRYNMDTGDYEVVHIVDGEVNEHLTRYADDILEAANLVDSEAHRIGYSTKVKLGDGAKKVIKEHVRALYEGRIQPNTSYSVFYESPNRDSYKPSPRKRPPKN